MTKHFNPQLGRGILAVRAEGGDSPVAAVRAAHREIMTAFDQFKQKNSGDLDEIRSQITDLASRNASVGLGIGGGPQSAERHEVNAAFRDYIRGGDTAGISALIQPQAGMSVGSDPEGGYSAYPTVSEAITKRIFESSPLRQYARVVTISTDRFEELLDLNEPDAAWVGETEARPATGTPPLGKLEIPAHELYAMPKITQKLLDDSSLDLAGWLTDKVSSRFLRQETAAFFAGDGIRKPKGFLTYPTVATPDAARPWGKLEYVPTGVAAAISDGQNNGVDALVDLQSALKAEYRQNAVWQMNRRTAGKIRKLKDGDGNYLWQNQNTVGQPPMLLGHPVILAEDMPDVAAGAYPVAFGDFRAGYTIVDRLGERLLRDPFTAKPHVLFYMYRRVGGDVNNFEAIKLLKVAAS